MSNTKSKLIAATALLVVGIVAVVTASVAWFTISTSPEVSGIQVGISADLTLLVSKTEEGDYTQMIDISEELGYFVSLKPVSTVDGVNWFIPTYEESGELKDANDFTLDNDLSYANVYAYETEDGALVKSDDGTYIELEGEALTEAEAQGYYIYTEFWLMTEEDGANVRLSVPNVVSQLEDWEIEQGTYGTYVLDTYFESEIEDNDGVYVIDSLSQTAVRVGFLIEDEEDSRFVIYEPNADMRSYEAGNSIYDTSSQDGSNYIIGYEKNEADADGNVENYADDTYIETQPIGITIDDDGNESYEPQTIDENNLIIQSTSAWEDPTDNEDFQEAIIEGTENSNYVATFGEITQNTIIVTLEKDTPQKVTVFIWIEGQDVDCWNDIAFGNVMVNLELAGETLYYSDEE